MSRCAIEADRIGQGRPTERRRLVGGNAFASRKSSTIFVTAVESHPAPLAAAPSIITSVASTETARSALTRDAGAAGVTAQSLLPCMSRKGGSSAVA